MAVNFNSNSVFNLKPINKESVRGEVNGLLIGGEDVMFHSSVECELVM